MDESTLIAHSVITRINSLHSELIAALLQGYICIWNPQKENTVLLHTISTPTYSTYPHMTGVKPVMIFRIFNWYCARVNQQLVQWGGIPDFVSIMNWEELIRMIYQIQ